MTGVPQTFRRESRLFLWVALLLVLFLNLLTLHFLRRAVDWGSESIERRAADVLRHLPLFTRPSEEKGNVAFGRAALDRDVLYVAEYDATGRRLRTFGPQIDAPETLPTERPEAGRIAFAWRKNPTVLVATAAARQGFISIALDPGPGAALRSLARSLTFVVPIAGAALVVLAGFYLRSLLSPYDRLLAAAGSAPAASSPIAAERTDEREFLIGRFEATIAALRDKERELRARADDLEAAARLLSRNLPTGLLSIDPQGTIVELNESGREILQVPGDLRGGHLDAALSGAPEFRDLLAEVLRDKKPVGRREVHWTARGEPRSFGVTVTPAQGADGRFLGVLALFTDLTEMRRLEARIALTRHLADLGQVSAGAAHEFRNAAAAIDGFADLGLRSPDRAAEHLRAIRREAQEMSRVTSDFLLFARPEAFAPEPVDLTAVATGAVAETETAFPGVQVELDGSFPIVSGSEVLLRRALVNLLRNAVEATPAERRGEPSAILLKGWSTEGELFLAVADRGEGIAASLREEIFLPFYSTKPRGSGFGLAIVARIIELHGGTVQVDPRPGGGALFTLRLPEPDRRARPGPSPSREPRD
ncbi:MAG TPA: ATP-binding protein [Thermoanaerobaculia bacterium]|nr:ATP-binding protein [Thermoanaerobaculia bacterium]